MVQIVLPNPVVGIRNDCKAGQFKIGENRFIGDKLNVTFICPPFDYVGGFYSDREDMSDAARKKQHNWKQLWFIAAPGETKIPKNTVFPMLVKTASISELAAFSLLDCDGHLSSVICQISFKPKSNDYGTYYMLCFEAIERKTKAEKEQLKMIESFFENEPLLYDASLPPGMIPCSGSEQSLLTGKEIPVLSPASV